jgi:hypothetical protein
MAERRQQKEKKGKRRNLRSKKAAVAAEKGQTVELSDSYVRINNVDSSCEGVSMIGEQSKTTSTGCQIDKIIFDQLVVGTVRIGAVDAGTPDRRDPTSIQNQVRPESKVSVTASRMWEFWGFWFLGFWAT